MERKTGNNEKKEDGRKEKMRESRGKEKMDLKEYERNEG